MNVKLAATIYTDELEIVRGWLTKYFGFTTRVDWLDRAQKAGRVICEREGIEIAVCGVVERSAEITLLVDDVDELSMRLGQDGVEHHFDRDAGERPIIHFPPASPFAFFAIEEQK